MLKVTALNLSHPTTSPLFYKVCLILLRLNIVGERRGEREVVPVSLTHAIPKETGWN